jgi:signal transduction histidine kinase
MGSNPRWRLLDRRVDDTGAGWPYRARVGKISRLFSRADVALSIGLAVAIVASSLPAPSPWLALDLAIPVLLLWRRVRPLPVAIGVGGLVAAGQVLAPATTAGAGLGIVFALLVAVYSVAAHERDVARAALGGVAVTAGANLDLALFGLGQDDFWPFRFMYFGSAWAVGRIVLGRREELEQATTRAMALERDQEARTQAALAEERGRLARELHDVIAHNVSVMVVQAGAAEAVLEGRPEGAREPLRSIQETGRQTVIELRRLLGILKEGDAEWLIRPQPSLSDLEGLVDQVRRTGLAVEVSVEGQPDGLPASVDLSAYRIVQEALTNALRHAGATCARVRVRHGERFVDVEVVDDGRGSASSLPGHGLLGIRERVTLFGGTFEAGNRPGGGFGLRAILPFERAQ